MQHCKINSLSTKACFLFCQAYWLLYKILLYLQREEELSPVNSVIIYLVSEQAKVNARDMYGSTPLHFAAMRGNEMATKELLSCKGINIEVNTKSSQAWVEIQPKVVKYR